MGKRLTKKKKEALAGTVADMDEWLTEFTDSMDELKKAVESVSETVETATETLDDLEYALDELGEEDALDIDIENAKSAIVDIRDMLDGLDTYVDDLYVDDVEDEVGTVLDDVEDRIE